MRHFPGDGIRGPDVEKADDRGVLVHVAQIPRTRAGGISLAACSPEAPPARWTRPFRREFLRPIRADLKMVLGIAAEPGPRRPSTALRAMPQYYVGHLERVATIEKLAPTLPGLALCGAFLPRRRRARLRRGRMGGDRPAPAPAK